MNYLIYETKEQAQDRSHQEAVSNGAGEGSTTAYWWSIIEHPETSQAALKIDNPTVLNAVEQLALKDQEYMDSDGWFVEQEVENALS